MSKQCQVCGKIYQKGNLVPRGIGNRVTRRTISRNSINLRVKRFVINGRSVKIRLCASCLKRLKKDQIDAEKILKDIENKDVEVAVESK